MLIIPTVGNHEFQSILNYTARPCKERAGERERKEKGEGERQGEGIKTRNVGEHFLDIIITVVRFEMYLYVTEGHYSLMFAEFLQSASESLVPEERRVCAAPALSFEHTFRSGR